MMSKKKIVALLMVMVLMLSQGVVFAEGSASVLEIVVNDTVLALTLDELKAMPEEAQIDEEYVYNSKSGEKTVKVKGISLEYILKEKAGVTVEEGEVILEASDGYELDPQTLQDIFNGDLKYVVAYEVDGEIVNDDDNADIDDVKIYRKVKEAGEFGTVFKLVNKIIITPITEPETPETETEVPVTEEPVEEVEISFTDIKEEFKFAEAAILELAKKGIINGIGNGLYAPEKEFTRAEFCKVIIVALGYEVKDYTGGFSDVAAANWFAPYVQSAVEAGLFNGNSDGTFLPNKIISRQEMAAVAGRAAVLAEKITQEKLDKFVMEKSNYADKDLVPEWAANEVAWLEAEKVFAEIAVENFEPAKAVNRAEAALIVFNTLFQE